MPENLNRANNSYNPTNTDKNLLNLVFGENGNRCDENICPGWILGFILIAFILFILIFCTATSLAFGSSIMIYLILCVILFFLFYSFF